MIKNIFSKIFEQNRIITMTIIGLLTVYSFSWQLGYKVFYEDQLIYLPVFLKSLDPSLFVKDLIFSQEGYTLFGQLIAGVMRIFSVNLVQAVFIITFATRFVFFYSLYRLASYFTGNRLFGLLAPLLVMAGFRVYGTNIYTIDSTLLPRDIGMAISLFSLSWLLYDYILIGAILLSLSVLVHPAMAIPFILFFYAFMGIFKRDKWKSPFFLISMGFPVLAYLGLFLTSPHLAGGLFSRFDANWLEVIMSRTAYVFLGTWKYPDASLIFFLVSVYMFFVTIKEVPEIYNNPKKEKIFYLLFFIPILIACIALFAIDGLHMVIPAQFQLGRAFIIWKLIFSLTFAYFALKHVFQKPKDSLYNFLLLGIILSFVISEKVMLIFLPTQMFVWFRERYFFLQNQFFQSKYLPWCIILSTFGILSYFASVHQTRGFFYESIVIAVLAGSVVLLWQHYWSEEHDFSFVLPVFLGFLSLGIAVGLPFFSIQPKYAADRSFIEACEWIKRNTPKDAMFISEPFSREGSETIRLLCLRSLFITKKDGGQVLYGRDYAMAWKERYGLVVALSDDIKLLPQVVKTYNIDYAFSKSKLSILYTLVFDNGTYFIYKLK